MGENFMNRRLLLSVGILALCLINVRVVYGASFGDMFGGKKSKESQSQLEQKELECRAMVNQKEQEYQRLLDETKDSQDAIQGLRDKNSTLMEAYEKVVNDQKNIIEQLNRLRRDNQRCENITESFDSTTKENQAFLQENESLEQDKKILGATLESLKLHIGELTTENQQVNALLLEAQESDEVKMRKMREKIEQELEDVKRQNNSLKTENDTLSKLLKEFEKKANLLNASNLEIQQQTETLKGELASLEREHVTMKEENRYLAREASELPKKFTDLARHNQKLVKESSHMHYNMGVSFIKSKDYDRAVKEFKKVLELDPDDAYANYNLGYIYAEHLVDRQKAIEYFQNYLTYAKDEKDADWVKKYILTWQTWYGKEKVK